MNKTSTPPEIALRPQLDLFPGFISDQTLALLAPIIAYWTFSTFFYLLDEMDLFAKYRIHPPAEVASRNKCSKLEVFRAVVLQHILQTATGLLLNKFEPAQMTGHESYELWKISMRLNVSPAVAQAIYYLIMPAFRLFMGFFILDTWQYMLHRAMHMNKFLYKHFHSVHHRLYVPYAFGALYNSLVEGFLLDTVGAGLGYLLTGMSTRESIVFYTFSTLKTVDDHCGYDLPWDPLQILFPNKSVYHDIHHQSFGIKTNFSQPFFIHWDEIFNTKYKDTNNYIQEQKRQRKQRYEEYLKKEHKKTK
ncbi:sphingosine hydroxylase [Sugiyamaella lignohabitans]|uniref:Sphingosine hydroxylase n=1 Tax=Sugiyamaella lignohabitans TaxID=796027 RepID=A0A167FX15_9ASCO|nr:sphingosine hydroxylase [Sugiyamaella lignohabitans]ANB15809.1 sphingosine hydroxylase [Sugiyamaella lignohabitans]